MPDDLMRFAIDTPPERVEDAADRPFQGPIVFGAVCLLAVLAILVMSAIAAGWGTGQGDPPALTSGEPLGER